MGRVVEKLHHFHCRKCKKWWSVADASVKKTIWFCPWCGHRDKFKIKEK